MACSAGELRLDQFSPHHVQGCLRGPKADALAVAGEPKLLMVDAGVHGQCNMHQTHGLVDCSASRSGNSSDSQSKCRACLQPNALGQAFGHFGTYSTTHLDDKWWNACKVNLRAIAVAGYSRQKIAG